MDPIPALIARVDKNLLTRHLFHLSADPLPCRKLNYTRPGADRSTLHEADNFLAAQLESYGYTVEKEAVPVQALRTDRSRPMPHQFARPAPTDPWYTATLADLMDRLNRRYGIGLEQGKFRSERPNDDDGSFIKAGFPAAVLNIGSFPYADPHYHGQGDSPDKVDPDNLLMSTRLSLAFVVHLDIHDRM